MVRRYLASLLLLATPAFAAVELDADSNGATDVSKGGTNATTAAGARTALGVPATAATLVGDCTVGPCFDGSADGGNYLKFWAGTGSYWTALQGGAPDANRSWRLPIAAAPAAGETLVMTMDEYGQMGFLAAPETSGYVLGSTDAGVLSWVAGGSAGDNLGAAAYSDVVALWTTCTGYLKSDGTCDTPSGSATYPSAAGVANWDGSAWGTSYAVGTAANDLVQLNASAQLPAVSADLLTITDTGTYFTTDTVAAALQELGSGLADVTEITLDASLTETGGVLSVTNPATDYDTDGDGDFTDESWFPAAGIGGSTGSTDNAILRANGTGGSTAQAAGVTIDDNDNITTAGFITGLMQPVVITTAEGADDTSTDAEFLTDSGETWPTNAYIGMTLYNVTDGSSCVVTANTATTMTCTLAGGTDNDWDSADVWAVAPGPKQSGSMFYIGSATTILHPAIAGYGVCYMTTGANAVSVDPQSASMALYLNGATIGDGDEIDIPNAAGNYACLHNKSATVGYVLGAKGTIADGGSN